MKERYPSISLPYGLSPMSKKCQIPPITSQMFLESTSSSPTCFVCPDSGLIPYAWKTRSPSLLPGSPPPGPAAVTAGTTCATTRHDYLHLIPPCSTLSPSLLLSSVLASICLLRSVSPYLVPSTIRRDQLPPLPSLHSPLCNVCLELVSTVKPQVASMRAAPQRGSETLFGSEWWPQGCTGHHRTLNLPRFWH